MAEKIKVDNLTDSQLTINLTGFNGKAIPLNKKGFAYLSQEELAYVRNTSSAFERGVIKVANPEAVSEDIDIPDSPNALTDEDITSLLKKPLKQVQAQLETIDSLQVARKILETAKEQDKSVKVVEAIEAHVEKLLG